MMFDPGSFVSGLAGVVCGGGLLAAVLRHLAGKVATLETQVQSLRDNHVASIEKRLEQWEKSCGERHSEIAREMKPVERLTESVRNLNGWLSKVDLHLGAISDGVAGLKAEMQANAKWLGNLNDDFQAHQRDRELHRHG